MQLLSIQEHCFFLTRLINQLVDIPDSNGLKKNNRFYESWLIAGDWLHVATSINDVSVTTINFDNDDMVCGEGISWESERSELIKKITKLLVVFNFIWGCFENIAKIIGPNQVNKSIKNKRTIVDDCLYYLKKYYPPRDRILFYDKSIVEFREALENHSKYKQLSNHFKVYPFCGIEGLGLHIVRIIRNDFAHGAAQIPLPPDDDNETDHIFLFRILELSSRLMLMTIQMLPIAFCSQHKIFVLIKNEEQQVENALKNLHLCNIVECSNQLCLFD